jgi:hypothetical protein
VEEASMALCPREGLLPLQIGPHRLGAAVAAIVTVAATTMVVGLTAAQEGEEAAAAEVAMPISTLAARSISARRTAREAGALQA